MNALPQTIHGPSFDHLLDLYQKHLWQDVVPFWLEHCIDQEHDGLLNCIDDAGCLQSYRKYIWSQGRALWTFSALYDSSGDERYRTIADNLAKLLLTYGRDESGAWVYCLERDGTVAMPAQSIYVDAFAIIGLTEYARVTGCDEAIDAALESYRRTTVLLDDQTDLPTAPHQIPHGLQSHGLLMIFALAYHHLGVFCDRVEIRERALYLADGVMDQHVKPDMQLLLEFVRPGGAIDGSDAGQTYLPGHAIESMWIMHHIYAYHGITSRLGLVCDVIRWHLEKGWDDQYGGLYLACHAQGKSPAWHQPDAKVWWPHCEALYALLLAYQTSSEPWCMQWYVKVHDYTFSHFPDHHHGEWRQNLDRQGNPIPVVVKDLAVKDPFHLPRALLYCIRVLKMLTTSVADG